jgi:hypothetical protein
LRNKTSSKPLHTIWNSSEFVPPANNEKATLARGFLRQRAIAR